MKRNLFLQVAMLVFLGMGCKSGVTQVTASAIAEPQASGDYVCHLDCSRTESSASGKTEEEARRNVSKFVKEKCRPEDGQYFIFCGRNR